MIHEKIVELQLLDTYLRWMQNNFQIENGVKTYEPMDGVKLNVDKMFARYEDLFIEFTKPYAIESTLKKDLLLAVYLKHKLLEKLNINT